MHSGKAVIYLKILERALLNIRALGERGEAQQCVYEADHVHNIPGLLLNESADNEKYYLECKRKVYLGHHSERKLANLLSFDGLWHELEQSAGKTERKEPPDGDAEKDAEPE